MGISKVFGIINLINLILATVTGIFKAQDTFREPGSGPKKKEAVINDLAIATADISTGGQKQTWNEIARNSQAVSSMIDGLVGVAKETGILKRNTGRAGMTDQEIKDLM